MDYGVSKMAREEDAPQMAVDEVALNDSSMMDECMDVEQV